VLRAWNGRIRLLGGLLPWFDGLGLEFDLGPACGAAIGLATAAGVFVALGLVCSGLGRTPLASATLTFAAMALVVLASLAPRSLHYWQVDQEWIDRAECLSLWGYVDRASRGVVLPREMAGCAAVVATLVWLAAQSLRPTRSRGVFVLAIGMAGLATIGILPRQIDVTRRGVNSLSPLTGNLLDSLEQPVEVALLAANRPRTASDQAFSRVAGSLRDLVGLYRGRQPLVALREIDPETSDAGRRMLAQFPDAVPPCVVVTLTRDGRTHHEVLQTRDVIEAGATGPGGLAAAEFMGESALTAALARLAEGTAAARVCVLTGHGELSLDDVEPESRNGLGLLAQRIRELGLELVPLDLRDAQRVPADACVVLIAGGLEPFEPIEIDRLETFLSNGGRALVLVDLVLDPRTGRVVPNGLERLLADRGVELGADRVTTRGFTGRLEAASPALPSGAGHSLARSLAATAVTFYECRSVQNATGPNARRTRVTPLLVSHSAPRAWAEADLDPAAEPQPGGPNDVDGPVTMSAAVERQMASGREPQLVVVGDAEFAANRALAGPGGRPGFSFLLSSLNWLRGRNELLGDIAPRRYEAYQLAGSGNDQRGLVWKSMLALVALMTTAGATVWSARRNG
jgi:hypothetical protein